MVIIRSFGIAETTSFFRIAVPSFYRLSRQSVANPFAEGHIGYVSPDVFTDLGRDPKEADIVVCKLGYLTADQDAIAKRSIIALTKGSTNEDLKTLNYTKVPRPIFPLDEDFSYEAKDNLVVK